LSTITSPRNKCWGLTIHSTLSSLSLITLSSLSTMSSLTLITLSIDMIHCFGLRFRRFQVKDLEFDMKALKES
jgi:hypothetical protein